MYQVSGANDRRSQVWLSRFWPVLSLNLASVTMQSTSRQIGSEVVLIILLAFIILPLAEIAILVYVGTILGVIETIIIVVVTGLFGASLARWQGFATLAKIRASTRQGILPADEILNGALILAGGLFFITPGLITDTFGLVLLLPAARTPVIKWIKRMLENRIERRDTGYWRLR